MSGPHHISPGDVALLANYRFFDEPTGRSAYAAFTEREPVLVLTSHAHDWYDEGRWKMLVTSQGIKWALLDSSSTSSVLARSW